MKTKIVILISKIRKEIPFFANEEKWHYTNLVAFALAYILMNATDVEEYLQEEEEE